MLIWTPDLLSEYIVSWDYVQHMFRWTDLLYKNWFGMQKKCDCNWNGPNKNLPYVKVTTAAKWTVTFFYQPDEMFDCEHGQCISTFRKSFVFMRLYTKRGCIIQSHMRMYTIRGCIIYIVYYSSIYSGILIDKLW